MIERLHTGRIKLLDLKILILHLSCTLDHSCGYCSLLPNLKKGFGWNPGKKLNHWFGEQMRERTGDYDITFKDVRTLPKHSHSLYINYCVKIRSKTLFQFV